MCCSFEEKFTISSEVDFFYPVELSELEIIGLGFEPFEDGWYKKGKITWNIYDKMVRYYNDHFKHGTNI